MWGAISGDLISDILIEGVYLKFISVLYFVTDDSGCRHQNMSSKSKSVVFYLRILTYSLLSRPFWQLYICFNATKQLSMGWAGRYGCGHALRNADRGVGVWSVSLACLLYSFVKSEKFAIHHDNILQSFSSSSRSRPQGLFSFKGAKYSKNREVFSLLKTTKCCLRCLLLSTLDQFDSDKVVEIMWQSFGI